MPEEYASLVTFLLQDADERLHVGHRPPSAVQRHTELEERRYGRNSKGMQNDLGIYS